MLRTKASARALDGKHKKPHIEWRECWDCGHDYSYWKCTGERVTAFGETPRKAYEAWWKGKMYAALRNG